MNTLSEKTSRIPAAAAGSVTTYVPAGNRPLLIKSHSWFYESTEANADNTYDFAIEYTTNGGGAYTNIVTNANAGGLLDTGAVLTVFEKFTNAGAGGGAMTAATFNPVRVPANAVIRFVQVTAGTGTVPAIQHSLHCIHL